MKKLILPILLLCMSSFGVEVPQLPAPNGGQYAIELFKIETPHPFDQLSFKQDDEVIEHMFTASENTVSSLPVMYANIGETVENDQTEKVLLPEDYNVVGGKPVPINKLQHLGTRTRVTLKKASQTTATLHLNFHHQVLQGYETYKLGREVEVEIPYFETRKVDTVIVQKLGSWIVVGGIESKEEGSIKTSYYIIRISKPGISHRF